MASAAKYYRDRSCVWSLSMLRGPLQSATLERVDVDSMLATWEPPGRQDCLLSTHLLLHLGT